MEQNNEKNKQPRVDPVTEFYTSYNNEDRDMTTLEHGKRGIPTFLKVLIAVILSACAVAAWIGYLSFSGQEIPFFQFAKNDSYIDVKVSSIEKEIISNSLFTTHVFIKNTSPSPLDPVSIIIDYPQGFVFNEASPVLPKNEQKNYWEIGSLTSGEEITLTISGRISGSGNLEEKNIHTTVFYKPVNLSSEFKKEVDTLLSVNPAQFRLRIDGPVEVEHGGQGDYKIVFHKPSTLGIVTSDAVSHPPLMVVLEHPKTFTIKEIKPSPTDGQLRWDIMGLNPDSTENDTTSISLSGFFNQESTTEPLNAKIGYYLGNEFVILDQTQFLPSLAVPFEKNLLLSLTLDGKSSPLFLTPSEPDIHKGMPLTISYENRGKIILQNVSFKVHIPKNNMVLSLPEEWNIPKSDPAFSYTYHDGEENQILITPTEMPILTEIGAAATGTISLFLRSEDYKSLRTRSSMGEINENPLMITLSADIGGPQKRSLAGSQVVIKRNSDTSFKINKSSENTPLAIEWIVENTLHELENIRLSAILPESIPWTESTSVSAGTIRYNSETREVLWTINRLPTSVKSVSARFELEGTLPEGGTNIVATLTAKDKTTGALISIQKTF